MLSKYHIETIVRVASRYSISGLFLFGSATRSASDPHDIDIGVKGLPQGDYFRFYADLIFALPKPVDLIDLSTDTIFNRLVEREGVRIYG